MHIKTHTFFYQRGLIIMGYLIPRVYSQDKMKVMNYCRLYSQVTILAVPIYGDGKFLTDNDWYALCDPTITYLLTWNHSRCPYYHSFTTWNSNIGLLFLDQGLLYTLFVHVFYHNMKKPVGNIMIILAILFTVKYHPHNV